MKNIKLSVILVLLWVSAAAQDNEPSIQFGLVADIQYAQSEPRGSRYYSNSLHKIQEAVNYFNAQNVLFTINLGDIVDRNFSDIDSILPILNQLKNPIYHITGNHDYKGVSDNDALYAKLSMPSGYYSRSIKNWTFIMLNTNEVASYSNIAGTHMEQELSAMMDNIKTTGKRQGQPYNGGISQRQLAWLSGMLQNAQNNAMNVLIFAHHPLYPEYAYNALNNTEILRT
jgi:beta-galactosidase